MNYIIHILLIYQYSTTIKQHPRQVGSRTQLDGAWSFQAQLDALRACNREDRTSPKQNGRGPGRFQQLMACL